MNLCVSPSSGECSNTSNSNADHLWIPPAFYVLEATLVCQLKLGLALLGGSHRTPNGTHMHEWECSHCMQATSKGLCLNSRARPVWMRPKGSNVGTACTRLKFGASTVCYLKPLRLLPVSCECCPWNAMGVKWKMLDAMWSFEFVRTNFQKLLFGSKKSQCNSNTL